jgi:hypothetical protein
VIDDNIKKMQDHIDQLNQEIFKNPNNVARPPSEYLEVFKLFTGKLHCFQVEREELEAKLAQLQQQRLSRMNYDEEASTTCGGSSSHGSTQNINQSLSMSSLACSSPIPQHQQHPPSHSNSYFDYEKRVTPPPPGTTTTTATSLIPKNSSQSNLSNHSLGSPSPGYNTANLPTFKLNHPTSLSTTINNNKFYQQHVSSSSGGGNSRPATPMMSTQGATNSAAASANNSPSMCTSLTTSPATTPTLHHHHNHLHNNQSHNNHHHHQSGHHHHHGIMASVSPPRGNPTTAIIHNIAGGGGHGHSHGHGHSSAAPTSGSSSLTPSTSSLSLPLNNSVVIAGGLHAAANISNGNVSSLATTPTTNSASSLLYNHNGGGSSSRNNLSTPSSGIITHNSRSFGDINDASACTPSSISPSASIAGTPTLNFPLLRIFIGTSTAVVGFF